MKLVDRTKQKGKAKTKRRAKLKIVTKKKSRKLLDRPKRKAAHRAPLLAGRHKAKRGGARHNAGRFSLFRPKIRTRAYPVLDNAAGWKIFDKLAKQTGLSGSDLFNLGLRRLAAEFGTTLSKATAIAMARRLADIDYKFAKRASAAA